MWSYPYMFLYKALVFQAKFLDSSLSSSGYISETNDLRATKICQGMKHDMSTWDVDVSSKVKNQGHGVCLYDRFLNGCISVNF